MDNFQNYFGTIRDSVWQLAKEKIKPFFIELGKLHIESARKLLKNARRDDVTNTLFWSELTNPLMLMIECEKKYYTMSYLVDGDTFQKPQRKQRDSPNEVKNMNILKRDSFSRTIQRNQKDSQYEGKVRGKSKRNAFRSLQEKYRDVIAGIPYICNAIKVIQQGFEEDPDLQDALHVIEQLPQVINCRLSMMLIFYELANATQHIQWKRYIDLAETLRVNYLKHLRHSWLSHIRENTIGEIFILGQIFKVQFYISHYQFKDTFVALTFCRYQLNAWANSFGIHKDMHEKDEEGCVPRFIPWAFALNKKLVAKATFYFYDILKYHSSDVGDDFDIFDTHSEQIGLNYCHIIQTKFIDHYKDISSFNIVLDCRKKDRTLVNGYNFNNSHNRKQNIETLKNWPIVLSLSKNSSEDPLKHWPNIIAIITENNELLKSGDINFSTERNVNVRRKQSEVHLNPPESISEIPHKLRTHLLYDSVLISRSTSRTVSRQSSRSVMTDSRKASASSEVGESLTMLPEVITTPDDPGVAYLIKHIEENLYLVVIFINSVAIESQAEAISKYVLETCTKLRLTEMFARLKCGNKSNKHKLRSKPLQKKSTSIFF